MVIKKADGYHVVAESGRHMGGPYKSRSEAERRLQVIEAFKHMEANGTKRSKGGKR